MKYWNKFNLLKINLKESVVRVLKRERVYCIISFGSFILVIVAPLILIELFTLLLLQELFDVKNTLFLYFKDVFFGILVISAFILSIPKLYKLCIRSLIKLSESKHDILTWSDRYSWVRKGAYYVYTLFCIIYSCMQIKDDASFSMSTLIYLIFMIFMASDESRLIGREYGEDIPICYLDSNCDGEWKLRTMKCDGLYYSITIEATQNFNFLIKKKEDNDISTIKDIRENTTINNSDLKTGLKTTSQGGENFWVPMGANRFKITYNSIDSEVKIKLL